MGAVDVGVDATVAGEYTVSGLLSGSEIDWANTTAHLNVGSNVIKLNFDGNAIYRHGENGLFITTTTDATAPDLAAQLRVLSGSPALRQKLGATGCAEARARYDWSRIAQQLEELYQAAERQAARRYGRKSA